MRSFQDGFNASIWFWNGIKAWRGVGQYLWEEYRYRHDLIWRLLFRVTTVATALSIAPFGIEDLIVQRVGRWITVLPWLAFVMVFGSIPIFLAEDRRFGYIKEAYRETQKNLVDVMVHIQPKKKDVFTWLIPVYLGALLLLTWSSPYWSRSSGTPESLLLTAKQDAAASTTPSGSTCPSS